MTPVNKFSARVDTVGSKIVKALLVGVVAMVVTGAVAPAAGATVATDRGASAGHLAGGPDDWPWRAA